MADVPIKELWAFIAENPEGESILSAWTKDMVIPLVTSKAHVVDGMKKVARNAGRLRAKRVKLVKFSVREDIEDIT